MSENSSEEVVIDMSSSPDYVIEQMKRNLSNALREAVRIRFSAIYVALSDILQDINLNDDTELLMDDYMLSVCQQLESEFWNNRIYLRFDTSDPNGGLDVTIQYATQKDKEQLIVGRNRLTYEKILEDAIKKLERMDSKQKTTILRGVGMIDKDWPYVMLAISNDLSKHANGQIICVGGSYMISKH